MTWVRSKRDLKVDNGGGFALLTRYFLTSNTLHLYTAAVFWENYGVKIKNCLRLEDRFDQCFIITSLHY